MADAGDPDSQTGPSISGGLIEQALMTAVESYFEGYSMLDIPAPVAVSAAVLGCRGVRIACNPRLASRLNVLGRLHDIDRQVAVLPNVVVESLDVTVQHAMRPIFDAMWNASGFPHSLSYNEQGDWSPRAG